MSLQSLMVEQLDDDRDKVVPSSEAALLTGVSNIRDDADHRSVNIRDGNMQRSSWMK